MNWMAIFKQVYDWFTIFPLFLPTSKNLLVGAFDHNIRCIYLDQHSFCLWCQKLEKQKTGNGTESIPMEWVGWPVGPIFFLWKFLLLSYLIPIYTLYSSLLHRMCSRDTVWSSWQRWARTRVVGTIVSMFLLKKHSYM